MAIVASLNPTADGDIQLFGGTDIDTTDTIIAFTQSGGLIRNAIFEFDLSSIPDGSAINSVSLDMTLTRFVSNVSSNPAAIDIFAFAGDVRSFALSPTSFFDGALAADLITIRIETDSFASINIAALENSTFDPVTLNINFEPADPVPAPAFASLFAGGLAVMGMFGWRRKRLDAA